jgi:glycosyltransferase involved in cell wall biosynthesis
MTKGDPVGARRLGVVVFPEYSNPYQRLLYDAMEAATEGSLRVRLCPRSRRFWIAPLLISLVVCRAQGYRIFHLHWLAFDVGRPTPFRRLVAAWGARFSVSVAILLGYRLVWTAHNVVPHEKAGTDDAGITRYVVRRAAAVIVHSDAARVQLAGLGAQTSRIKVIPHGHYIDVYPISETREHARQRLGLSSTQRLFLFFGLIRPYKGVESLIEAFVSLPPGERALLIVGRCYDEAFGRKLTDLRGERDNVQFHDEYIADEAVASYFMACDAVCLPFSQTTTSGSALLALSFGKPVVLPRLGGLEEIPDEVGYFYQPGDPSGLRKCLEKADRASAEELVAKGAAAFTYASGLGWHEIAESTVALYLQLLGVDR